MIAGLLGDCTQTDLLTGELVCDAAPESPKGAQWEFVGAWTSSLSDPLAGLSAQDVISQMASAVGPDFAITSSTPNPAYHMLSGYIQLVLLDNTGHAHVSDGQLVIQNAFAKIVGSGNVQSNSAMMVSGSGGGPSSGSGGASNPGSFSTGVTMQPQFSIPTWVWYAGAGLLGLLVVSAAVRR